MNDVAGQRFADALAPRLRWLTDQALPLWAGAGVDPRGGFYEKLDQRGAPLTELTRRARVVARQTYVFVTAVERGWGDYAGLVAHGIEEIRTRCLLPDGLSLSTYTPDGAPARTEFDGYDQAFILFALASAARLLPEAREALIIAGERLLTAMRARFRHPERGFEEAVPRRLPLLQNPHMHLFEACLAFDAVPGAGGIWREQAGEIVELARAHLMDRETHAIHEFFDGDWHPVIDDQGGLIEPGHQFEWAWLLWQWADRTGDARAAGEAERLYRIGTDHGIAPGRQVIDALDAQHRPRAATSRLWPQTERLKACLAAAEHLAGSARAAALDAATATLAALDPYFATPVPGLWYDRLDARGMAISDPAPASSLYHIVCALDYAARFVARGRDAEPIE